MKKKKTKRKLLLRAASLVLAALILCPTGEIYSQQTTDNVSSGEFLKVDYNSDDCPPLVKGVGGEPKHSVSDATIGGINQKCMTIMPDWTNWGYAFNSPIPKDDGDYEVSFDFSGEGLSTEFYTVSLVEKESLVGENVYHQFGLLKITNDGDFMVAGCATSGIKYNEKTWYNYRLIFNQVSGNLNLVITEKDNPENIAEYNGMCSSTSLTAWGASMPDRSYDMLRFGITGTLNIANISVAESTVDPLSFGVASNQVGNIFSMNDEKKLDVSVRNKLNASADIEIEYEVTNEDGNSVDKGSVGNLTLGARETADFSVVPNVERYDCYDITFKYTCKNKSTGETAERKSKNYMFSVVNKRDESEPLNPFTAVNIAYMENDEMWQSFKQLMLQIGLSAMRKDYTWYDTEPYDGGERGKYIENPVRHRHFKDAVESGIGNLAILGIQNPLYSPTGDTWDFSTLYNNDSSEMWLGYQRYLEYSVKKHKDDVTYWEVVNEPNWVMSAETYCKILKMAAPIIKKNDPDGIVMGLCTGSMPWSWIEGVFQILGKDAEKYMDVITIHPYDFDSGEYKTEIPGESWSTLFRDDVYEDKIVKMKELMKKYDIDIPIEITELAVSSTPLISSVKGQAADCAQMFATTKAQGIIEKVYWYCMENTGIRGSNYVKDGDTEANFGLVGNRADVVPYAAKPSYLALAAYNKLIGSAEYVDGLTYDTTTRAYRFKRGDGKQVIMLWNDRGYENIALDLGTNDLDIYDMYSNKEGEISSEDGVYNFTANFEPIYIVGDFKKFERTNSVISVDNAKIKAVKNDNCVFNITDTESRNLRIEAVGTPNAVIEQNTGIIDGKGKIEVKTTDNAFQEEPICVKVYDGENLLYYAKYYAVIQKGGVSASYELTKEQTGADRNAIAVSVTNETAGIPLDGILTADFTKMSGKREIRRLIGLKPGETGTVYLNVPKTPYIKSVETTAKIDLGDGFKLDKKISYINDINVRYNNTGKKDWTVFGGNTDSGDIFAADDELAAESYSELFNIKWGGTDDCSFKGTLLWDEDNLYVYCDVKDDVLYQKEEGDKIWMGDCLQIGFQDADMIGMGVGNTNIEYTEIGVAKGGKSEDDVQVYRWSIHPSTTMNYGVVNNCDIKIDRVSNHTIYRMVFPWTETIGREKVEAGATLRFNLIANDNDGSGRRGFVVLTKGIGETKNATMFGNIKLVK